MTGNKKNPFAASVGSLPVYFGGKHNTDIIEEILESLNNPNKPSSTSLIRGTSGIGKTTLLNQLRDRCIEQGGWIVVSVSNSETLLDEILQQAYRNAQEFVAQEGKVRFSGASAEVSANIPKILQSAAPQVKIKVSWDAVSQPQYTWRTKMSLLLDELSAYNIGLMLLVDEATKSDQMNEFMSSYVQLIYEGRLISLVLAGLPVCVDEIINEKNLTFARRCNQIILSCFTEADTRTALSETAKYSDKHFSEDALSVASAETHGFPYMMQLVGHYSFDAAGENDVIDLAAVRKGIQRSKQIFRKTIVRSEVLSLNDNELNFLLTMASSKSKEVKPKEINDQNQWQMKTYSMIRQSLIQRGMIEKSAYGTVEFAMPELKEYLLDEYLQ